MISGIKVAVSIINGVEDKGEGDLKFLMVLIGLITELIGRPTWE